jgi:hypothetical protein
MMIANVPMERSMYESELKGSRSWIMGSRKDKVFPEPVWDWMNMSLAFASTEAVENTAGNTAR